MASKKKSAARAAKKKPAAGSQALGSAGYSGTPLHQKLGIAADKRVGALAAPEGIVSYLETTSGASFADAGRARGPFDVILLFVNAERELRDRLPKLEARLDPAGALWVGWPKKSSGIASDVTEDRVRAVALPRGLVDVKVCAIDEVWSGLKLVVRREKRARTSTRRSA